MASGIKNYLRRKFLQERVTSADYVAAFLLAIIVSAMVYGLEQLTVERFSNISGLLILAVLLSAILFGTGPAILTALSCSFLYDWLMVPPFLETDYGADNLIKFSVFVAAALLTSWIAGTAKTFAIQLSKREKELSKLLDEREDLRKQKELETVRREVETLRNAILTSVSHDLKTPLSSIIGAISSYKFYGHDLSEADRRNLISMVLAESNRLLGYMDNILDMARLENTDTILKRELVEVDDVIDLAVKRLSSQLRGYRLDVRETGGGLFFIGDERMMDIAVGNLLDNAMKYSPAGSTISVRTLHVPESRALVIELEDQGTGIPAPLREEVFDKYYRVRHADSRNEGIGLGLWITRRIVEAHSGHITLDTPPNGCGTLVRIELPAAPQTLDDFETETA